MWPCCADTASDDGEHNTDNTLLLLFADAYIAPALLAGLTDVDAYIAPCTPWLQIRLGHFDYRPA